jgi:hypothetical protein
MIFLCCLIVSACCVNLSLEITKPYILTVVL